MSICNTRNTVTTIRAGALALVSLLMFAGGTAQALITGLRVDNYSPGSYTNRQPSKSFNGTATDNSTNPEDGFMTNNTATPGVGSIAWSLSGKYTLNTVDVYNYCEANRGAQQVDVYYSSNYGVTYNLLGTAGTRTINQYPTPTTINFGGVTATNVKFNINSNYGDTYAVGLNEVEFNGTADHAFAPATITATAASSAYPGRPFTGATDGVIETVDPSKMWMSNGQTTPTIKFSLGANPQILDHLDIWNYNENTLSSRGIGTFRIRLLAADGVTSLGLAVNDADPLGLSTTFTLNPNNGKFFDPLGGALDGNTLMDTVGIRNAPSAYFFQIEALSNLGDPSYAGLTEVQAFVAPEPASLGLLAVGATLLLRKRRA